MPCLRRRYQISSPRHDMRLTLTSGVCSLGTCIEIGAEGYILTL